MMLVLVLFQEGGYVVCVMWRGPYDDWSKRVRDKPTGRWTLALLVCELLDWVGGRKKGACARAPNGPEIEGWEGQETF